MASDIQPAADCFYGFAIYGDFRSLRDRPCHHNAGGTVYHIWQGDITIFDPDRRTGRNCVCHRIFSDSSQADYCKGAGGDTGDLQHGLPRRHGGHGEAGDYRHVPGGRGRSLSVCVPVRAGIRAGTGICYSIFHAVSAFCNAGIDILGANSFADYAGNPLINITTMLLIMLSGIGFSVWHDVITNGKRIYRHEVPKKWWFTRLRLHSKLAIVTTLILLAIGTIATFLLEYHNPETMGDFSFGKKVMASMFQSVTTRTAGFFTVSQSGLTQESKLLDCILMFIGGSPGGTAGGVKTTTIAMLVMACITFVRGGKDTECFGRKITMENFRTGFAVAMLAFLVFITGTVTVLIIEPASVPLINVMYETASAIGTVGLTADLTPSLARGSQAVIMVLMYVGRIGPLTLALVFAGKPNYRDKIRELPNERIMVG